MIINLLIFYIVIGVLLLLFALMEEHGWDYYSEYLLVMFWWLPLGIKWVFDWITSKLVLHQLKKLTYDPDWVKSRVIFKTALYRVYMVNGFDLALYNFAFRGKRKRMDVIHEIALIMNKKKEPVVIKQTATGSTLN